MTNRYGERLVNVASPIACSRAWEWIIFVSILSVGMCGCSAMRPLKGVPANYYPRELGGESRSGKRTIDLSLLRQTPTDQYRIDSGDVLGVYIEGVLGRRDQIPPVHFPQQGEVPPSLGYPIPVRDDGTITVPLAKPILVRGMTVRQVEEAITKALSKDQDIINAGVNQPLVSLQKPRTYNVLVIRQEANSTAELGSTGRTLNLGTVKRGSGKLVSLPAYKNDVLHALAETGGLPGLDAENTIFVIRRRCQAAARSRLPTLQNASNPRLIQRTSGIRQVQVEEPEPEPLAPAEPAVPAAPWGHAPNHIAPAGPGHAPLRSIAAPQPMGPGLQPQPDLGPFPANPFPADPYRPAPNGNAQPFPYPELSSPQEYAQFFGRDTQVTRIPVRLHAGEMPQFNEQDIILQDGDIVFIESRDTEIFYTGGLLGGGQFSLPRDYDLDVLGAISIATANQGTNSGAGFGNRIGGVASTNQDISVGASDVVVLRQLPDGNQIPIKVDLNKALRDPKHRIRIEPGDYIVLQYKPLEAVCAFVERNLLAGGLIGLAATNARGGK